MSYSKVRHSLQKSECVLIQHWYYFTRNRLFAENKSKRNQVDRIYWAVFGKSTGAFCDHFVYTCQRGLKQRFRHDAGFTEKTGWIKRRQGREDDEIKKLQTLKVSADEMN